MIAVMLGSHMARGSRSRARSGRFFLSGATCRRYIRCRSWVIGGPLSGADTSMGERNESVAKTRVRDIGQSCSRSASS